MTTVVSQSELTKRAINWISEQFQETGTPWNKLMEQAAMRFNLSPKDVTFLERFFRENEAYDPCDNSKS